MKTLYLDCGMGAAGDMLAAALLELLPDPDGFLNDFRALHLPGVQVCLEKAVKCGITGSHFAVSVYGQEEESLDGYGRTHAQIHDHDHEHDHAHTHEHGHDHGHSHHHSSMADITQLVNGLALPEKVRQNILAVYQRIAQAESKAHGTDVEAVHFHEVGTMDAVADITLVCMLLDRLAPDEIIASPVRVGFGQVRCAHGILPVPAPATAYILQGAPIYAGDIRGELCTPTGAALLKQFVGRFGEMPMMQVHAIGYGCGKKDFAAANCLRALLGESEDRPDRVSLLSCNLDDMTGEEIGFAVERLFAAGALDVWTAPIGMKKSRPGVLLSVLCPVEEEEAFSVRIFRYTTTLGIRVEEIRRRTLPRTVTALETTFGTVRRKEAGSRMKYEYEDLAAIARERNLTLREAAVLLENVRDPD